MIWMFLAAGFLAVSALTAAYLCFRIAFLPEKKKSGDAIEFPVGEIYKPYYPKMEQWIRETRALPREDVSITSFDGLTLWGSYYEYTPGAPVEIMFHGYRGTAERDLSGGVQRCFSMGRSALLVDQRCCGRSQGKAITFGIREHRDCLAWARFASEKFGPDVKLILTGISMGAATVMMVADKELPQNVIGILADCGYSSPWEILRDAIRKMGLPVGIGYAFSRLGARIFAGFDPEEWSPVQALENSRVPVIFFHGEADEMVPCDMSRQCYEACASRKRLVTVPGAGHGLCYVVDRPGYVQAVTEFFGPEAGS